MSYEDPVVTSTYLQIEREAADENVAAFEPRLVQELGRLRERTLHLQEVVGQLEKRLDHVTYSEPKLVGKGERDPSQKPPGSRTTCRLIDCSTSVDEGVARILRLLDTLDV